MLQLTRLRKRANLTSAALARRSNLNPSTLSAIERGHLRPYPGQLVKLCRGLSWPEERAEELLEDVTDDARD